MPTPDNGQTTTRAGGGDWHNEPHANAERQVSVNHELGLVTVSLSIEEIDALLYCLDGSIACGDPLVGEAVAILHGARHSARRPADVPPAAWGVR